MAGLFSPLTIRNFTLRNRIVLPPMANDMANDSGAVTVKHIQHYERRAAAGVKNGDGVFVFGCGPTLNSCRTRASLKSPSNLRGKLCG